MTDRPTLDSVVEREIGTSKYTYNPKSKVIKIDGQKISIEQDSLNDPYMMCKCKDSRPIGEDFRGRDVYWTCPHLRKVRRYFIPEILDEVWKKIDGVQSDFMRSYEAYFYVQGSFRFLSKKH
jgi:hypothetical protein